MPLDTLHTAQHTPAHGSAGGADIEPNDTWLRIPALGIQLLLSHGQCTQKCHAIKAN